MQPCDSSSRPFKQRKSLATRMHEVTEIRIKYPNKIPVVVERYQKEKNLPPLTRTKFLVSQDLPLSQFVVTLRTRLCLGSSQTFYLLVNNKGLPNMAITMQELYQDNKDEDGFLYLTYASQEMFGSSRDPKLTPRLVAPHLNPPTLMGLGIHPSKRGFRPLWSLKLWLDQASSSLWLQPDRFDLKNYSQHLNPVASATNSSPPAADGVGLR
ncbi:microtubule-associated proteins 1A/1B light chain 3C-like [Phaenicophaeus curvirostris]|uniref:microtubule-associated proteins 1A/1B light chain 3C-like n=1 Tax=Phaenicophaeus curvirostris TaxID=33595 RepID=UPI0037F0EEED